MPLQRKLIVDYVVTQGKASLPLVNDNEDENLSIIRSHMLVDDDDIQAVLNAQDGFFVANQYDQRLYVTQDLDPDSVNIQFIPDNLSVLQVKAFNQNGSGAFKALEGISELPDGLPVYLHPENSIDGTRVKYCVTEFNKNGSGSFKTITEIVDGDIDSGCLNKFADGTYIFFDENEKSAYEFFNREWEGDTPVTVALINLVRAASHSGFTITGIQKNTESAGDWVTVKAEKNWNPHYFQVSPKVVKFGTSHFMEGDFHSKLLDKNDPTLGHVLEKTLLQFTNANAFNHDHLLIALDTTALSVSDNAEREVIRIINEQAKKVKDLKTIYDYRFNRILDVDDNCVGFVDFCSRSNPSIVKDILCDSENDPYNFSLRISLPHGDKGQITTQIISNALKTVATQFEAIKDGETLTLCDMPAQQFVGAAAEFDKKIFYPKQIHSNDPTLEI